MSARAPWPAAAAPTAARRRPRGLSPPVGELGWRYAGDGGPWRLRRSAIRTRGHGVRRASPCPRTLPERGPSGDRRGGGAPLARAQCLTLRRLCYRPYLCNFAWPVTPGNPAAAPGRPPRGGRGSKQAGLARRVMPRCLFRRSRPLIPSEAVHLFRAKPFTDSAPTRTASLGADRHRTSC